MKRKKIPKSFRKHIRLEKARIRRENLSLKKQKELIDELSQKFLRKKINVVKNKNEDKRNLQSGDK